MSTKTNALVGPALDWAVAAACGWTDVQISDYQDPTEPNEPFFHPDKIVDGIEVCGSGIRWKPSTDWAQGGPILDRMLTANGFHVHSFKVGEVEVAFCDELGHTHKSTGTSLLLAAMRCFVTSKMGNEIEIPEELK